LAKIEAPPEREVFGHAYPRSDTFDIAFWEVGRNDMKWGEGDGHDVGVIDAF
jgi:hypothetical protein